MFNRTENFALSGFIAGFSFHFLRLACFDGFAIKGFDAIRVEYNLRDGNIKDFNAPLIDPILHALFEQAGKISVEHGRGFVVVR